MKVEKLCIKKFIFAIPIFLMYCSCSKEPEIIEIFLPLPNKYSIANKVDTIGESSIFLIKNFNCSNEIPTYINEFACSKAPDFNTYAYKKYTVYFYRMSKVTNEQNLRKNPGDFINHTGRYDYIGLYKWEKYSNLNNWGAHAHWHNLQEYKVLTKRNPCE